jgi:hypothetical protein
VEHEAKFAVSVIIRQGNSENLNNSKAKKKKISPEPLEIGELGVD